MKNENVNFILILIAYINIGLFFSWFYVQNNRLNTMNDSINRLIKIEMITEQQFNLLYDEVKDLRKRLKRDFTIANNVVH